MKTSLIALGLLAIAVATSCDRREMAENQPSPQPSDTADAAAARDAAPSGAQTAPATAPTTPADTAPDAMAADARPDDGVALGWLAAVDEHEIAAAKQAKEKGVTGEVRDYADMMETQHGENLEQTKALGTPGDTPEIQAMKTKGEADLRTLGQGSGADYARAYIKAMVDGHQEALGLIDDKMLPAASSEAVKAHLSKTRAAVETHLAKAKEIAAKL